MRIKKFDPAFDFDTWNLFISKSKNSTFLFDRKFMDYHADRFTDHSLLIYDEDEILGVIPANITADNELVSHQGLTYGAIVLQPETKLLTCIKMVYQVLKFLSDSGIQVFNLKHFHSFYNPHHTEEIDYILFLVNAKLNRRDVAFVIDQQNKIAYSGNIRREGNKAEKLGASIVGDDCFEAFWDTILTPNLLNKHGVKPVHTLTEIQLLKSRFPQNIKQYNVYFDGEVVAGTTLFITPQVVHCQYISANDTGRKTGALNFLFKSLIDTEFSSHRYFDFGIVNEDNGKVINNGMLFWKESFGGRAQKHDFYRIDTSSYKFLENYI